jgi:hypothetical protein
MACFTKPLAVFAVVILFAYLAFRKTIDHVLVIVGVILEYVLTVLMALVVIWLVLLIMRGYQRWQARKGACLTCEKPCQLGGDHAQRPVALPQVRVRDEKVTLPMPAVSGSHDENVIEMAAWKERHEEPSVG